jgi:hypothetical protein
MNTLGIMDVYKVKKNFILVIFNSVIFIINLFLPIYLLLNYMETDSRIILFFSGIALGFSIEYAGKRIKQFYYFWKLK